MLAVLDPATGTYRPWGGQPVNGQAIPLAAETTWTIQQLNAAGVYPVVTCYGSPGATAVPDGQMITGPPDYSLAADGQHVDEIYPLAAIPAPVAMTVVLYPQASDDAAAAALNPPVPVGGLYCNGSQVMQRQS